MRFFSPLALLSILFFSSFSLLAQDAPTVRVGVVSLRSGVDGVSVTQARDKLVTAINRQKPNKDARVPVEAVALEAPLDVQAMAEARDRRCEFVLSTDLASLNTTFEASSLDGINLPTFHATLEFRLIRVADGSEFASGSVKGEDSGSTREAIWRALTQVASKSAVEIMQGKGSVTAPDGTAAALGNLSPLQLVNPVNAQDYCTWLPSDIDHAEALRGVCRYAIPLREKMPNFVCEQSTMRYRGQSRAPIDQISASVRYEDGHESYSEVKVNGRAISGAANGTPGLRSTGEFGGNLRAIFNRTNRAKFRYSREDKLGDHAAWIFTYEIAEQKEPLWLLQGPNHVIAPPYSGELWVDQKGGAILRFRSVAKDMPPDFPMRSVDLQIDYEDIVFGDGTDFVLPVDSSLTNVLSSEDTSRNVVQFRDCHKFRAKAHIVLAGGAPAADAAPVAIAVPSLVSVEKDLADNEAIYTAIAEREVHDSNLRNEAEQKQELNAAAAGTLARFSALQNEQRKIQAQAVSIATGATPVSEPEALTTLKVKVNLVLVPVVLRDAAGRAIGNLSKDSFRVIDSGKPQVITRFSVEKGESKAEGSAASGATSSPRAAPIDSAKERDVAYVFDDLHGASDLANAKEAALRHLARLQPGDRAAIVSTSGQVQLDFTDDRDKLTRAIQSLKPFPTPSAVDCPSLSLYMADLMVNQRDEDANNLAIADTAACLFGGGTPSGMERERAQRVATAKAMEVLNAGNRDSQQSLRVLQGVIRRTAFMPGKKSIVLVSPGFLTIDGDAQRSVGELIDQAIRSDIVVNALDMRGLSAPGLGARQGPTANPVERLRMDSAEASVLNGVMAELAHGTGGVMFENNNDLDEGFRRTADAPEYIYVLGFSPQKLDGKFHKLKVSVTGSQNLTVQARKGYFAPKPEPKPERPRAANP